MKTDPLVRTPLPVEFCHDDGTLDIEAIFARGLTISDILLASCTESERANTHYIGKRVVLLKPAGVTVEYVQFLRTALKGILICVTEKEISEEDLLRAPVSLDTAVVSDYAELLKSPYQTEFAQVPGEVVTTMRGNGRREIVVSESGFPYPTPKTRKGRK